MTGCERSWRPLSLIAEPPPHNRREHTGPDLTVHALTAYDHGVPGGSGGPVTSPVSLAQKVEPQA